MSNSASKPIYAIINQAISSGFTFSALIVASRILPVDEFGVYSLLVLTLALLSLAPQAFVFMPMMSLSREFSSLSPRIYPDFIIFCLVLFLSLGIALVLYFINLDLVSRYVNFIPVAFWIISFQVHEFLKRVLFIGDRHKELIFFEIVKIISAIITLSILSLWSEKLDIDSILISISVGYSCFSLIVIARVNFLRVSNINPMENFTENFDFGKWIFLGNGISYIQNNFFVYVTALLLPLETVAGLNAVRSLIGFSTVIFLAIDNYLAPKLAAVYQSEGLKPLYRKVISFYVKTGWLILIIYLGFGFFAERLVTIIFGERYLDSSFYLQYFLIASFLGYMARPLLILSRTVYATKIIFWGSVSPAIFALIFSYPLILAYGDMGAVSMAVLGSLLFLVSLAGCFWNYKITTD